MTKLISISLFLFLCFGCNSGDTNLNTGSPASKAVTITESETVKSMLGIFDFNDCTELLEKKFKCSCTFNIDDYYRGPSIYVSDSIESACVKIDGELNALYPDWEERDYKDELKKLAQSKDWILVKSSGVLYFGKPLEYYKYENAVEFLTDVILASGKEMKAIPIQNTVEGMAIGEVTNEAKEAIAKAKSYRSKGGDNPLYIVKYDNEKYDVFMRYRQVTKNEEGTNKFEGKIILLQNRGETILETKTIKGTCGC